MSEFARSLHLFGATIDQGVEQMRSTGISGAVVGAGEISATLLMEEEEIERYIPISPYSMLHYVYEADYGLWLYFYKGGSPIASVVFAYENEGSPSEDPDGVPNVGPGRIYTHVTPDIGNLLATHGVIPQTRSRLVQSAFDELAKGWQESDWEAIDDGLEEIGEALGLYAFRWLHEGDALSTPEELLKRYPEGVIVEGR